MAQNRKAPAFQEYAAQMLVNKEFKLMTLEERGLLSSMRYWCWENKEIPSSLTELAKYLGFSVEEIKNALTDRVKSFFNEIDGSFTCPELDNYREHLEERKAKQSAGGKVGSSITNGKNKTSVKSTANSLNLATSSSLQVPYRDNVESITKIVPEHSLENVDTSWADDYARAENLMTDYQKIRSKR